MKSGDCVKLSFPGSLGVAKILVDEGFGFYKILFSGEIRMMHEDYMEVISESR